MKIIVTGSSSGIGNFLASHFSGAGHEVWGIARSAQDEFVHECAERGMSVRSSRCDVSDWQQICAFRDEVMTAWGYVDAVICCAGIQGPLGPAMTLDPVEWSQSIRINLDGVFHTIRAFHAMLLNHKTSRGKIFCFSGGGSTGARPNFTPYACAKTGVVRLVENLASEWIDQPIDIIAIAPGAINTRMTEEVLTLGPAIVGENEFRRAKEQKRNGGSPLLRVATMIELLISPAGDGITGKLLSVPWDPWPEFASLKTELMGTDVFNLRRIVAKDRGLPWE